MPIFWRLCQHYAFESHKRKACSVWVSLRIMRIPLYAKKCEARSPLVWAQVRWQHQIGGSHKSTHQKGRRVGGSFGGIFIFSQFSGQIYSGIWSTTEPEYPMGGWRRLIGLGALEFNLPSLRSTWLVGVLWKANICVSSLSLQYIIALLPTGKNLQTNLLCISTIHRTRPKHGGSFITRYTSALLSTTTKSDPFILGIVPHPCITLISILDSECSGTWPDYHPSRETSLFVNHCCTVCLNPHQSVVCCIEACLFVRTECC